MVALQVFDKLPALPPAIKCDTEPFDNPVENSPKRRRLACSECRACLGLDRSPKQMMSLTPCYPQPLRETGTSTFGQ
jgi:hypothetical protein